MGVHFRNMLLNGKKSLVHTSLLLHLSEIQIWRKQLGYKDKDYQGNDKHVFQIVFAFTRLETQRKAGFGESYPVRG